MLRPTKHRLSVQSPSGLETGEPVMTSAFERCGMPDTLGGPLKSPAPLPCYAGFPARIAQLVEQLTLKSLPLCPRSVRVLSLY